MLTTYQFVVIGHSDIFGKKVEETFSERVIELGLGKDMICFLDQDNFNAKYQRNCPTVAIYFGDKSSTLNLDILDTLIADAVFIIPVVNDLNSYTNLVPSQLREVNGMELKSNLDIESVAACAMEALSLLRLARRLFISYRRLESRSVAIQLYEYLDQCGFDVFLDTHSLRPGEQFQDELWHRLVDTDVVVLLDTPDFLTSEWTEKELAKASAMSIGILQLIWPNHTQNPYSSLSVPINIKESDFEDGNYTAKNIHFNEEFLKIVGSKVESLRARNLASRQDNLIQEFTSSARYLKFPVTLQPEKFLTLFKPDGMEVAIIPTVGVPHAFTYNQTVELMKRIRKSSSPQAFLLYDQRNIVEKWQNHLTWLNDYLPVQTIKVTEIENWIKKL